MDHYLTEIGTDTVLAAEILKRDGIVAVPTETVYGLAGNALREEVVKKIYKAKGRPADNPLIVHVAGIGDIEKYAKDIPKMVYNLMDRFSPGPLTVVLPKRDNIPYITTGGLETVGLRIPKAKMFVNLLKKLDFPLAAPSANIFTGLSPTSVEAVMTGLEGRIPYILDGGRTDIGIESTIVRVVEGNVIEILRKGAITDKDLAEYGEVRSIKNSKKALAPGSYPKHYSPDTKLLVAKNSEELENMIDNSTDNVALLLHYIGQLENEKIKGDVYYLSSEKGPDHFESEEYLKVCAQNLFYTLHQIDQKDYKEIITVRFPNKGIGSALNDKLSRASQA